MWILFLLLFCSSANADVYVITASDKSVYSISEQDDAIVPNGYTKHVLAKKTIKDLTVTMGEEKLYDFNGSKFTLNSNRVNAKNKAESDAIVKLEKEKNDRTSAITKLKAVGLTDDEISSILK